MRIVKISELSEEEKKKVKQRQEENAKSREKLRIDANNKFNELIKKKEQETTKQQKTSLWQDVQSIANSNSIGQQTVQVNTNKSNNNNNIPIKIASPEEVQNTKKIDAKTYNTTQKNAKEGNVLGYIKDKAMLGLQSFGDNILNLYATDMIKQNEKAKSLNESLGMLGNPEGNEKIDEITKKIKETTKNTNYKQKKNAMNIAEQEFSKGVRTIGNASESVGAMLPSIGVSMINPSTGLVTTGISSAGSAMKQAMDDGATAEEAQKVGVLKGSVEVATEKLFGGVKFFGKGTLDDIFTNTVLDKVSSKIGKFAVKQGYDIVGETIEENLTNIAGYGIDKLVLDKDMPTFKQMLQDADETTKVTVLSTILLKGLGASTNVISSNNATALNAKQKQDSEKILSLVQDNVLPEQSQSSQNQQNIPNQQVMPTQQKNAQNTNIKQNNILPMQSYVYEKSDNVKVDNLRQSASKYFDNSEKTKNYMNMLEKIITDKDIDIRFDANLKDSQGRVANGSYSNGIITINPNSNRAGEFIAIHELTHAIGTNQMRNIVEQYRKNNVEFNSAVQQLLKNYNTTEITEEAMADVSAQLFGNQEFINNLAQTEPSLFRKIYNEIKYLWHQFTGYSNQNQFIEDLQYKWEQAYRNNEKLNETTNYHIEPVAKFDETEYNNIIEEKIGKQEYAILRSIINSDSNIKPGINYVEVTNGRYTVYYKGFDDFKVMSRKVDADAGRINKRNDTTGRKTRYSKTFEQSVGDERTTTSNDEISTINTPGTRERSRSDTSGSTNIENGINLPTKESENNSGSFSISKNKRFDVTGNENLNNASTLFFRTREDGIYYVQATNAAGNITYDGTFIDKRSLEKTLGNEIAEYIAHNSEHTNNEIYLTSSKIENETDYMMSHRPSEEYGNGSNFESNMNGVFEHPEWYMNVREEYNIESLNALRKVRNKPNATITIYRATPGNKINPGDWITPSRKYAELHNNSQLNGAGNILELKVKAKDILWGGDDINEFGYFPDVKKYSLPTKDWQQYLDKNYKPIGTRTNLQDIKLPINENSKKSSFNLPQKTQNIQVQQENLPVKESNVQKYDRYKKNILKARAEEVNNLIKTKNETLNIIEQQITEKEQLLNSKKDKTTKLANNLKMQIENLKQKKVRVENEFVRRIDRKFDKVTKDKIKFETRNIIKKEARENLKAKISPLTEDLTKYKDKKAGILYNRETAQRNIDDIVSDKELAQTIKETIFDPIQVHQAEKTKEIKRLFDKINSLNLDKTKKYDYTVETNTISGEITESKKHIKIDEATLAQLLIEDKMTNQKLKDEYNMPNEQIEKINKTANTFTEILDYLYNKMNEEQIKYGYSPIGKLNNYFPHFFENKPDTMLGKIASYFGIDITKQDLPTEIAGKTDIFKPGKTWNSNTLQRKTNKTDYDALKAMQKYIQGATDIIYTTEDIQKVREYERQIRYQYSDKGIQESIDNILNDSELTQEAKDSAIDGVFKNSENELSNFVTWLNDYGNTLANKKSFADRNMERNIGRNLYSSMSGIESRIASNTIGGNLSISLTNFAPLFQAAGTTKVNYLLTGMLQTTSNNIKGIIGNKDINFVDNSNFLTNRFGTDTIAERTVTQKISDVASIPMNAIDEFTAESIVRGKYLENIDKGMTEEQALDNADKYAAKIMADRSKGALPIIFNAKNPISKLATMFQVEPNNIISNYLKDMPREATNKAELTKRATKLMVASYAFNTLVMAIRGGNEVLPDPIRWVSYLIKAITGDDEEKEKAGKDLAESVIGSIPFVSNLAGFGLTDLLGIDSDIGRIPISNAMPSITNIVKAFDSEADSQYRKETMMKEFIKPFLYLGFPTGGAQIKKTFEGISTVSAGGSYKTDKEGNKILQFPVENPSVTDYIRAGILGKYSLPMAKEYQERNFKSLSAKQTKTYEESNLPFKEYLEYIEAGLKTNEDKIKYLESKEMNAEQKWGIYTNDLFSSTERKEDGGSQLSDAKYITSNGVSKSEYIKIYNKAQKNNIDMPTAKEYKEMKSNNITLNNYIEYKVKVKELTESKRKSKELASTENLKNADKIQILLDSNFPNKEISRIYSNYIKSKEDIEYDIMKATDIDIKEYLKYKQQEFESDKEDDGTLAGKTVSKSKQKKVVKYLNSMNIKGNQRLLLYANQGYSMTASQKTQLANYVEKLKIDPNTKLKLYDKFSGFTVYKNGKVSY